MRRFVKTKCTKLNQYLINQWKILHKTNHFFSLTFFPFLSSQLARKLAKLHPFVSFHLLNFAFVFFFFSFTSHFSFHWPSIFGTILPTFFIAGLYLFLPKFSNNRKDVLYSSFFVNCLSYYFWRNSLEFSFGLKCCLFYPFFSYFIYLICHSLIRQGAIFLNAFIYQPTANLSFSFSFTFSSVSHSIALTDSNGPPIFFSFGAKPQNSVFYIWLFLNFFVFFSLMITSSLNLLRLLKYIVHKLMFVNARSVFFLDNSVCLIFHC